MTTHAVSRQAGPVTDPAVLSSIEQFLYLEAMLLDEWKLDEWLALMLPDGRYRVPAPGTEDRDPDLTLQVIHDDYKLLAGRITRLKSKHAHAETPKSHTRRMISNVRAEYRGDDEIVAHSNFHVLRNRLGEMDHFIGRYRHVLVEQLDEDGHVTYRIRDRLTVLDHDLVESGGTVSIVL